MKNSIANEPNSNEKVTVIFEKNIPDSDSIQNLMFKDVPATSPEISRKMSNVSTTTLPEYKEKSCYTLLAIVLLFLLTHSFRLALKMYEFLMPNGNTLENYERCYTLGR